jgi:ring-1,2-phenylacetyl-CoA epoxidase subunit PaaE
MLPQEPDTMAVPKFHTLKIREVRSETGDSISVAFDVPPELRDLYRFREGQFLTLRDTMAGEEIRRSYSVCCGVHDYDRHGELRVAIKRVAGGRFSNWANEQLCPGREIDVMTPDGRFFVELDPSRGRHYVGFAGGSGITPMLSLIKTTLATEPHSRFTLIYGNRSVDSIMFLETLEELKNRYMQRLRLYHVLSEEFQEAELFSGLLDEARCRELLAAVVPPDTIDEAFICGPAPMMDAAEKALRDAGVPAANIHIERFGTPAAPPPVVRKVVDGAPTARVVVIIDGKERHLNVPFDGPAILDAGLAAGANLPFACKAGVCCTCRARVLEGEVRMDQNYTLEPQEIAAGFVLTCQSHPVSDRIVVSYDER